MDKTKIMQSAVCIFIVLLFYFVIPVPKELTPHAWQLTGFFIATILAIIFKIFPIGAIAMIAIAYTAISGITLHEVKKVDTLVVIDNATKRHIKELEKVASADEVAKYKDGVTIDGKTYKIVKKDIVKDLPLLQEKVDKLVVIDNATNKQISEKVASADEVAKYKDGVTIDGKTYKIEQKDAYAPKALSKNAGSSISNALSGFSNSLIWLIGASIMISRGIIKTGLGSRIAYYVISVLGNKTLKIAYSLVFSEAILAPVTPSNTARGGGIIHPITKSICKSYDPEEKDHSKISTFLALVNYQTNPITSAMFITATAPNPLVVNFIADAAGSDFHISWGQWALGMFVPAVVCLIVMPLVVYFIQKPKITETPNAKEFARQKLAELGAMKKSEFIMIGIFLTLLVLWAGVFDVLFGIKINATTTAFIGLALALLTQVITWDDVLNEKSAWDTVTWFAALVMMATFLNKLGVAKYFAGIIENAMLDMGIGWPVAIVLLSAVFLYTHYFFASTTAHISAMFLAFYSVGISLGAPPLLFGFLMAASANLMMSLTHYATGTAPVIFGSGYVTLPQWWGVGFVVSVVNFLIFLLIGGVWWKVLGYW